MKRDFLDELEKQLVEAAENGRRKRLRFWVARLRGGRSAWIGIGGAALVMSSAAVVVLIVSAESGGGSRSTTRGVRHGVRGGFAGEVSQMAAAPSGHFVAAAQKLKAVRRAHARAAATAITVQGANAAAAADPIPATVVATQVVPGSFQPVSFTAVSEFTWWLLGDTTCAHHGGCATIVRTTDGGRSFVRIPAPHTHTVGQLRFATTQIGYAFGRQLWTTHDGGQRWVHVAVGGRVTQLSTAGGYVFALVHDRRGGWLMRSPIGLDDWQRLRVPGGRPFTGLWTQANQVLVETQRTRPVNRKRQRVPRQVRRLAISTDNGFRFTSSVRLPRATPCQINANLPAVWVHCAAGRGSGTWRSYNSGIRFHTAGGRAHHRAVGVNALLKLPSGSTFAAASATTAVVGTKQLYRTTNGGHSYRAVPTPRGIRYWQYLGFTDRSHGVALGMFGRKRSQERLYYTTNGGRSYHFVPISG
jgi:hypothetical protein